MMDCPSTHAEVQPSVKENAVWLIKLTSVVIKD